MVDVTYPPLDTLKPVADGLWIVDSGPLTANGVEMPMRMSVIRLASGDLMLISPTRLTPALRAELERMGTIRHLVAPSFAHWTMLDEWRRACPEALAWAAPKLAERPQVRASGLRFDRTLGDAAPPDWAEEVEHCVVPGGFGFREVFFFHRASRTLVLTDLAMRMEPAKLQPLPRAFLRVAGGLDPDSRAHAVVRSIVRLRRRDAAKAAERMLALAPERVIFAHGRWFEADGEAQLRRSLRWLI